MATPYLTFWCDSNLNRLYADWQNNAQASTPLLKQGDKVGVEVHWVKSSNLIASMEEVQFPPAATVTLAIGRLDALPTDGQFKVQYGTDSSGLLAHDVSATDLQSALNGLASITAEGGVAVTKNLNEYRIVWNTAGVRTNSLSADVANLSPTSDYQVVELKAGTASVRRILLLTLKQAPIAACTSFTTTDDPSISITSVFAGTWRVTISPSPRTGTFTLSQLVGTTTKTTVPIPYNADSITVQQALNSLLSGYSVIKTGTYSWDITAPATVVGLTANGALVGFSSVYGILDMNTAEVEEFLSAAQQDTSAYIEIQIDMGGEKKSLIQTPCIIISELISNSSFSLVNMGDVMPVDSVVRYDTTQTLTSGQKATARLNIGAASTTDLATTNTNVTNLTGRVTTLEGETANIPNANEKAALDAATSPSGANPIVTNSVLTSGLSGKADTVHTHTASQISDSSAIGRDILTAADAATVKSDLSIGTMANYNYGSVGGQPNFFPVLWDYVNNRFFTSYDNSSFQLFLDQAGAYVGHVGPYGYTSGGPEVSVSSDGNSTRTALRYDGISFPDGTLQTTAASGSGDPTKRYTLSLDYLGVGSVTLSAQDIAGYMGTNNPFGDAYTSSAYVKLKVTVRLECTDSSGIASPTINFNLFDATPYSVAMFGGSPMQVNSQSGTAGQYSWSANSPYYPIYNWFCEVNSPWYSQYASLIPDFSIFTGSGGTADFHFSITFEATPLY